MVFNYEQNNANTYCSCGYDTKCQRCRYKFICANSPCCIIDNLYKDCTELKNEVDTINTNIESVISSLNMLTTFMVNCCSELNSKINTILSLCSHDDLNTILTDSLSESGQFAQYTVSENILSKAVNNLIIINFNEIPNSQKSIKINDGTINYVVKNSDGTLFNKQNLDLAVNYKCVITPGVLTVIAFDSAIMTETVEETNQLVPSYVENKDSKVLVEKRTLLGNKKWVEEKK